MKVVMILFLGTFFAVFAGCETTEVAASDPFESRLLSLERKASRTRAANLLEEQEQMRILQQQMAEAALAEPDFTTPSDVISVEARAKR